jgi:hypothetical protein
VRDVRLKLPYYHLMTSSERQTPGCYAKASLRGREFTSHEGVPATSSSNPIVERLRALRGALQSAFPLDDRNT